MSQKIFIGNFSKGLTQNRLPFVIDNDAFPTLINAYSWRGRVKRKRGTSQIGRLTVQLGGDSAFIWSNVQETYATWSAWTVPWNTTYTEGVAAGSVVLTTSPTTFNIISGLGLEANAQLVKGNIANITITVGSVVMTDGDGDGILDVQPSTTITGATLNYSTGVLTLTFIGSPGSKSVFYNGSYYPCLPVMGLREFSSQAISQYPVHIAFDTSYSYQLNQSLDITFYYNTTYYLGSQVSFTFQGEDFQQFWTSNYEGAMWTTNGNPGMHFGLVHACSNQSAQTTITMTIYKGGSPLTTLINGDWLWFNEGSGTTWTLNGKAGQITTDSGASSGVYVVTFATDQTVNTYMTDSAMAQTLTNGTSTDGDGIRWYNGDPTGQTGFPLTASLGWVNFMPPLSLGNFGFDNLKPQIYYLAGATAVLPFKDRLLFFGPYIQSKTDTSPTFLQDTVIWSWNGTPYYSLPTPSLASSISFGSDPTAYYVDVAGKGGYLSAGIAQRLITVIPNEDVLLVEFTGKATRFVYTGNDLNPFLFYAINSELGTTATFSGITLDRGGLTIGSYGISITSQYAKQRIDLVIPDQIFQIASNPIDSVASISVNTGPMRVNAGRDFQKEWVYFTVPTVNSPWIYPTQTFLYNYRDDTWAVFIENYTAHGPFRRTSGLIWSTVKYTYPTWNTWTDSWDSSVTSSGFPSVCAGNQQGFVMQLADGVGEAQSQSIVSITPVSGDPSAFTINSPNHCLLTGDFLYLQGITGDNELEGMVGMVELAVSDEEEDPDNFTLAFQTSPSFTNYLGGGTYARLSRPLIQTKQFPVYWEEGRQVRLGTQQYLFDTTTMGQITVNINLSMDPDNPYNYGPVVPQEGSTNNSLVYSDVLYTSPEPNNLQMPTAANQYQIWHRMNTSLIGDTFQIGFTLSDDQMYNLNLATSDIVLQAMVIDAHRGPMLS